MAKIKLKPKSELRLSNIKGFIEGVATRFGTGAKVGCPKEFLGKKVYLVILND